MRRGKTDGGPDFCPDCPINDCDETTQAHARKVLAGLSMRGITCSKPARTAEGSPFSPLSFEQQATRRVIVTCGISQAVEEALGDKGASPTNEMVDQVLSGDMSALD